jgi:hypothetical protein
LTVWPEAPERVTPFSPPLPDTRRPVSRLHENPPGWTFHSNSSGNPLFSIPVADDSLPCLNDSGGENPFLQLKNRPLDREKTLHYLWMDKQNEAGGPVHDLHGCRRDGLRQTGMHPFSFIIFL